VGPRWNRQFKFQSPSKKHLLRNKSRSNLIRKRRVRYVHKADLRRVKKLIPYYKRKSLKMRY
jgi:ribosomal protein L35